MYHGVNKEYAVSLVWEFLTKKIGTLELFINVLVLYAWLSVCVHYIYVSVCIICIYIYLTLGAWSSWVQEPHLQEEVSLIRISVQPTWAFLSHEGKPCFVGLFVRLVSLKKLDVFD